MNRLYALLFIIAMSLCSACNAGGSPSEFSASETPPLEGAAIGGDFLLTDQDGESFSSDSLDGRYRTIYFGYTYCPDVCPVDLQKLMQGLKLAEEQQPDIAEKVQPLFITVDPERDRPEQIKQYVGAFHPRLIGLTGSVEDINATAKDYLITHIKRDDASSSEYLVDHSRQAYLFGPQGEPLALLPHDGTPQQIADEIIKWVS